MKAITLGLILCFSLSLGMSQDTSDWIVLNDGDTLFGKVLSLSNGTLIYKPKVIIDIGDGRRLDYRADALLTVKKNDTIFWSARFKPWRKDSHKLVFVQVLMQNREHYILKYENVIGTEWGPQYDIKYYHYKGRKFQTEVKNGNYRKIMEDHFSDCAYIRELLAEKKNFFYYDRLTQVSREYRLRCPSEAHN